MPSTDPAASRACRVRVRGVHKAYRMGARDVHALRGVDLDIEGPGFHAIMGPSGSGKSTLLHIAGLIDRADAGELRLRGQDVTALPEALRTRVASSIMGAGVR